MAAQWQQAYTYALKAAEARNPTILSLGGVARWYEIAALLRGGSADQAVEEVPMTKVASTTYWAEIDNAKSL